MIYPLLALTLLILVLGVLQFLKAEKHYRRTYLAKKTRFQVWCPKTQQMVWKSVVVRKPQLQNLEPPESSQQ